MMSPFAAIIGLFMIALFVFCFTLTVYMWYSGWKIKRDMEYLQEREKQKQRQYARLRQYRDRVRERKEFCKKVPETM